MRPCLATVPYFRPLLTTFGHDNRLSRPEVKRKSYENKTFLSFGTPLDRQDELAPLRVVWRSAAQTSPCYFSSQAAVLLRKSKQNLQRFFPLREIPEGGACPR
jgi:hypothetical protein